MYFVHSWMFLLVTKGCCPVWRILSTSETLKEHGANTLLQLHKATRPNPEPFKPMKKSIYYIENRSVCCITLNYYVIFVILAHYIVSYFHLRRPDVRSIPTLLVPSDVSMLQCHPCRVQYLMMMLGEKVDLPWHAPLLWALRKSDAFSSGRLES